MLDWAAAFGNINAFGVECTGTYDAGLTRHPIDWRIGQHHSCANTS